jgi:hypothetical protein
LQQTKKSLSLGGIILELKRMTEEEFSLIKGKLIADYAKEKINVDIWQEADAYELSKETINTLLKSGVNTENHYLYNLIDNTGKKNLYVWVHKSGTEAFIYTISFYDERSEILDSKDIISLLESEMKKLKCIRVSYHVFGHKKELINMMEGNGYKVTDITFSKKL